MGGKNKKKERKSSYTFQKNDNYSEAKLFQTIWKNWSPYQTKLVKMIRNIFQATCKGHDPSNGIWNHTKGLVILSLYRHLRKGGRLENQNPRQHQIWMKENGGSLSLNFISLPNPAADKNGSAELSSAVWFIFGNYSNILWMANSFNVSTFPYYGTFFASQMHLIVQKSFLRFMRPKEIQCIFGIQKLVKYV